MKRNYKIALALCALIVVSTFGTRNNYAFTLDLLGSGWNTSSVTVVIQDEEYISQGAIEDIEEALDDWNDALWKSKMRRY